MLRQPANSHVSENKSETKYRDSPFHMYKSMNPYFTGSVLINRKLYRNPLDILIESDKNAPPPLDPFSTVSSARKVQLNTKPELEAETSH
jgi:hypothetical protein